MNSTLRTSLVFTAQLLFLQFILLQSAQSIQAQDQYFPVSDFWNYDGSSKVEGLLLDSISTYSQLYDVKIHHDENCVLSKISYDVCSPGGSFDLEYIYSEDELIMNSVYTLGSQGRNGYSQYVLDSLRRVVNYTSNSESATGYSSYSESNVYEDRKLLSTNRSSSYSGGTSSGNSNSWDSYVYDTDDALIRISKYSRSFSRPFLSYDTVWTESEFIHDDIGKLTNEFTREIKSSYEDNGFGDFDCSKDTSYREIQYKSVLDTLIIVENCDHDLLEQKIIANYTEQIEYRIRLGNKVPINREELGYDDNGNLILTLSYDYSYNSGEWRFGNKVLYEYNDDSKVKKGTGFGYRDSEVRPISCKKYSYDSLGRLILIGTQYCHSDQEWIDDSYESWNYNCLGALTSKINTNGPCGIDNYVYYKPSSCDEDTFIHDTINVILCEGEDVFGHTKTGYYQELLCSDDGNDTLISITLNVLELAKDSLDLQLCEGETYNGYSESGRYEERISTSSNGCDSIFILNLEVLPSSFNSTVIELCPGEIYGNYDVEGIYIENYTSILGCDSIEQLELVYLDEMDPACEPSSTLEQTLQSEKLKVFPNPTTGTFRLSLESEVTQVYQLSIYSTDMELVTTQSYRLGEDMDVSYLSPSIYILNIYNSVETYTTKIVKVE